MGCVASGVIFLSVSWILVNALSYFSCTFVNVLSCVHVCINCKTILSYVEEIKNTYLVMV